VSVYTNSLSFSTGPVGTGTLGTLPISYEREAIREILKIRAKEENINISDDALEFLTELGEKVSLRYAIQLMAPAYERAKLHGRDRIEKGDIEALKDVFASVEESTKHLKEYEEKYLT